MNPKALKYESVIEEIEDIKNHVGNNFIEFQKNLLAKRAAERELEIIGEAMNKLLKVEPNLAISSVKKIISLRNFIIHAYDPIDDEIIWGIIQKDIPLLKQEIINLKRTKNRKTKALYINWRLILCYDKKLSKRHPVQVSMEKIPTKSLGRIG